MKNLINYSTAERQTAERVSLITGSVIGRRILRAVFAALFCVAAGAAFGQEPGRATRVPLQYEARPTVQNYENRPQQPLYQFPLSPKESMDYIEVGPEFDLRLFASEPEIVKPIAINWDHRGRLWVLESVDYPSTFTEQWQGHDKLVICEDTDGDGKADKFTTFFEGLNIATGFTFVNGGVLVAQAPNLIFLKDTDGDDKADVKQVIMGGWSKGDTHAGPSNLKWGFDNHVYGCVGYSGFAGNVGGEKLDFRQGPWRLSADYKKMEFLGQYNNNTWGVAFNEAGELFGSTANNAHHFYTPIPIPYFKSVMGLETDEAAQRSIKIDAHYAAHPITDKIRQVDVMGGYTAAAGQNLYTARDFPARYWNVCTLVNEPTMHLVHQGFLKRDGSGWTEDGDGLNLFAGEDEWVAPVHAEVGPDGAVWVADWYNFIIQHNPTPSKGRGGFDTTTGKGGAHVNPLRDHEHGRVYRVVYKKAPTHPRITLDPDNGPQLVETLKNDNLFWRLTAQRLLVERARTDVVPALLALAKGPGVDAAGINGGVIHALWTLHGLQQMNGSNPEALAVAITNLKHPSIAVRRNAAQVLPSTAESAAALVASGILQDSELNVRLAAFLAASTMPSSDKIGTVLFAQRGRPEVVADKYLPTGLKIAAARHAKGFLEAEIKSGTKINLPDAAQPGATNIADGSSERLIARNAGHRLAVPDQLGLLDSLGAADPGLAGAILDGLAVAWAEQPAPAKMGDAERSVLKSLAEKLTPSNQRRLAILAQSWGLREGLPGLAGQAPVVVAAQQSSTSPLSAAEQARFESGKARYMLLCIACHQPNGLGLPAVAPPLAGSEWVNGSEQRLVRMTLDGLKGPITAAGASFNLSMPAWREALDDTALSEILTFVRHEWGNDSAPIQPDVVARIRALEKDRNDLWTAEELRRVRE